MSQSKFRLISLSLFLLFVYNLDAQVRAGNTSTTGRNAPASGNSTQAVAGNSARKAEGPRHTISGTVKSIVSGETLIGASITVATSNAGSPTPNTPTSTIGVTTNNYGFFSLTLPDGSYRLVISAVGLETKRVAILLTQNIQLPLVLEQRSTQLQDVLITARTAGRSLAGAQMGVEHLSTSEIKSLPVLFGEPDVLKSIQLLPGVSSVSDGNSGFSVRGGSPDQNLILLDEAPVYNASHLLGFFSTFNSDAIKDVTLYKGDMPAQYGGRLSSVVDVRMNDGNNQDLHVNGGLGLISARINVEGPIEKDKSSFLISARRTYADLFLKLSNDSSLNRNSLYFYDLNAKLHFDLGARDKLYGSGYFGRDNLSTQNVFGLNWGNATGTLRWNHTFGPRLFSNTSLVYSHYDYRLRINNNGSNFTILSGLEDWNIKEELQWYLDPHHTLRAGFNNIYHTLSPGSLSANEHSGVNDTAFQKRFGLESAVFINDTWKISDKWTVSYGARLSSFSALGKGDFYTIDPDGHISDTLHYNNGQVVKTYIDPELRLSLSYRLNDVSSVKMSYADNTQNMHLISASSAGLPTDQWLLSNNAVRPERSHQVSLGYYWNFRDDRYELTTEVFYKALEGQIDYRDGANLLGNGVLETELLYGKGRAGGLETMLRKKKGRLTGWVAYTLSRSEKKIDGINGDQWYKSSQDRTHNVSLVGMIQLNKKWLLSADWVYMTGNPVSFPSGKYQEDGRTVYYYSERNGYRMPAYHRLDLSATVQLKEKKHFSSELAFGVYNAYNRNNAFVITFRDNKTDPSRTEAVQTSLFGAVPFISYNFKF